MYYIVVSIQYECGTLDYISFLNDFLISDTGNYYNIFNHLRDKTIMMLCFTAAISRWN